jgi:hypothetical protein
VPGATISKRHFGAPIGNKNAQKHGLYAKDAGLANAMTTQAGAIFGTIIAIVGVWVLFKTQLDLLEGMVRGITDILWTGSKRVRAWRGGDVRKVYYTVLGIMTVWGLIALIRAADRAAAAGCEHGRHRVRDLVAAPALYQHQAAPDGAAAAPVAARLPRADVRVLRGVRGALAGELDRARGVANVGRAPGRYFGV